MIGKECAKTLGESQDLGNRIGVAAGLILGVIAYWAVERPFRQRGAGRRARLQLLAAGFSACAIVCLLVSRHHPPADSLGLFDRPVFSGGLYAVLPWRNSGVNRSVRFYDVSLPPENTVPPEAWNNGGIVHNWGGGNPRVLVLGTSHAMMYGSLIDDICRKRGLSVAFIAAAGSSVFFSAPAGDAFPSPALAASFDEARRKWVRQWNPDVVFVIDRWDNSAAGAPGEFDQKLHALFTELAPHSRRVIVFSQVPVLRLGESENLREYVSWYVRLLHRPPKITPDAQEQFRESSIAAIEKEAHHFPNVELLRVDKPFYLSDGSVRYSSGRTFLYADDDHLTDGGTELVRELCTRAIAEATGLL